MFEKPQVMGVASALATHAAARQSAIAQNVANADTPGYRTVDTGDFAKVFQAGAGYALRQTRSGHNGPQAIASSSDMSTTATGGHLSPNGNSVSLEDEMVKAATTRADYDMALTVYGKSLDILRASLGRR